MNKYQKALETIKTHMKTYHRYPVNKELDNDIGSLQQSVDKAEKYDEKETPCKPVRIYPPFGDNVPVKRYPKLFGCGICGNQVLKHYEYCPECGNRIERGMSS